MKNYLSKIVAVSFLATSLFSVNAFAKTEGLTLGFGLTQNSVDYKNVILNLDGAGGINQQPPSQASDTSRGYAFNLKYALPITDGIYLAPSVFYEVIDSSVSDRSNSAISLGLTSRTGIEYSVNSRHGVKLDLGFDVTDELAVYATAGVGVVDYEVNTAHVTTILPSNQRKDGKNSSGIFGFGLNYDVAENLAVNFEYNRQQLNLTSTFSTGGGQAFENVIGTRIEQYQLGIAYSY